MCTEKATSLDAKKVRRSKFTRDARRRIMRWVERNNKVSKMSNVTGIKRRAQRTRFKLKKLANGRPRLTIHRTPRHIYAQVIDDAAGTVIASASTLVADVKGAVKYTGNVEAAKKVGETIGKAAAKAKIKKVVFDRGSFKYHGRIKALADAAREAGLEF